MTISNPFDDEEFAISAIKNQRTVGDKNLAKFIYQHSDIRLFEQGSTICVQGEIGSSMFYILSGAVQITIKDHEYKIRGRNELVGEMAVVEPGAKRSATMIAHENQTYLAEMTAKNFEKMCSQFPQSWRAIYCELAGRLRQRDEFFVWPNKRPTIFVASSSEATTELNKVVANLESDSREIAPWNKAGLFEPSKSTWEELERYAHSVDFAIILVTSDDIVESRGSVNLTPRDNVMLELGLFSGGLGRERTIILVQSDEDLKLPTDLNGVTQLRYSNVTQFDKKIKEISELVDKKGRLFRLRRK